MAHKLTLLLALALALALGLAVPASAAEYQVDTTADQTDGNCVPGACSIRDAIMEANATIGVPDKVLIPAGTYDLIAAGSGEELNATGDLDVEDDISILGAGAGATIIRDQNGDRVLHLRSATAAITISGVTIRDGGSAVFYGAGIAHEAGTGVSLTLTDVALLNNSAVAAISDPAAQGGGLYAGGPTTMERVTVSGNLADGTDATFDGQGGGLFLNGANTVLRNVTVSGNTTVSGPVPGQGGGIFLNDNDAMLINVTVSGNQGNPGGGAQGGGLFVNDVNIKIANSIVAGNLSGAAEQDCSLNDPLVSLGGNVVGDATCNLTAAGDLQGADPLLAALADNGGQVQTQALGSGSPALDRAADCQGSAADARGIARPQGAACDSGAFEAEVAAAPPPDAAPEDPAPTATTPQATPGLPPPVLRRFINAEPVSGTVRVRLPGARAFVPLPEARQIPVGSVIDARRGRVRITVAGKKPGTFYSAEFYEGMFKIVQLSSALTELQLVGGSFAGCPRPVRASARRLKKTSVVRRLWGEGSGPFRTKGRYSAATLRGTRWLTADRCDGTLTRVASGRVVVRDFARRKNVLLRARQSYVARPRRR